MVLVGLVLLVLGFAFHAGLMVIIGAVFAGVGLLLHVTGKGA